MYNEDADASMQSSLCHYLCVKGATGVAEVVRATEDKTREDFFLLDALQPQLQILPRTCIVCLHVIAQQAQNLHSVLQHTQTAICK